MALLEALRDVMGRFREPGIHEVATESITIRERMIAVMDALGSAESIDFEQLFGEREAGPPSRALVVATFLAILELARLAAVRLYQSVDESGRACGPIRLRRADLDPSANWTAQISSFM